MFCTLPWKRVSYASPPPFQPLGKAEANFVNLQELLCTTSKAFMCHHGRLRDTALREALLTEEPLQKSWKPKGIQSKEPFTLFGAAVLAELLQSIPNLSRFTESAFLHPILVLQASPDKVGEMRNGQEAATVRE